MVIEHRLITEQEFPDWRVLVRRGFHEHVHPDNVKMLRNERAELDRLFAAFADGQMVGTGGTDSHWLTVPGGSTLPVAGIAYITTAPTHRRRGVLAEMMRTLFRQAAERDEPLAALWASQAGLYSRFGFGEATTEERWDIATRHGRFAHSPAIPGRVRFVDRDEALRLMPTAWDAVRRDRAGFLDRTEGRWRYAFYDEERVRGDWSGLFFVVYEDDNRPEGYAAYRLKPVSPGDDLLEMEVVEAVTTSDASHAAIWRMLLDVDLVETLRAALRPPDDPLWWMLADPRRLNRTPHDGLWLRILDPTRALGGRTYAADGEVRFEVSDDFWPGAAGVFALEVSEGRASCREVAGSSDISLGASELGTIYLGGASLSPLIRSGRVREHTKGSAALVDSMFLADRAPWCAHDF